MSKYLLKLAASYHDDDEYYRRGVNTNVNYNINENINPYEDRMLERLDTIHNANRLLVSRGYHPTLEETGPGEVKAKVLLTADEDTRRRPERATALTVGALTGIAGGAVGALGAGGLAHKFVPKAAPIAALGGALVGGVLGGRAGYKGYYTADRRAQDDEYQASANKYLEKALQQYKKYE